jgi:hypothetical protein
MIKTVRRSYFTVFTLLVAVTLVCVLATSSGAAAGDTTRVSVGVPQPEGIGIIEAKGGGSSRTSISSDGRYVAFISGASNLVAGDTNGRTDIFVRDRDADANEVFDEVNEKGAVSTQRVSVTSGGAEANSPSLNPSISDDGRYVTFTTLAPLVPEDTNGASDVYVRDRDTDDDKVLDEAGAVSTKRMSVDSSGNQANGQSMGSTSISANGRFVAFSSDASNLLPNGQDSPNEDVFVRDRDTDDDKVLDEAGAVSTQRVSWAQFQSWSGNGESFGPSISDDGRFVAFTSNSSNLVGGDTNNAYDTFVRDRQTGAIQRANVDSSEIQAKGGCDDFYCPDRSVVSISSDGRFVTFSSSASNLAANDTNGLDDVFVRDLQQGTTQRVSVSGGGTGANALSRSPSISPDGRFVAFISTSSNLEGGDTNGVYDVFVHNRQMGTTQRVSVSGSGSQVNGGSDSPSISANGLYVAFSSSASNLVANDTNNTSDIFVHEQGAPAQQSSDSLAPTTNVSAGIDGEASYTSGMQTNQDVEVTLRAKDNEVGSEAKKLTSSATDAQPITSDSMLEPTSAWLGFAGPVKIPAGDSPRSVTSADFNGDGKADLATSNYASDNVSVLLRDGDGTFQAAQNLMVGDGPSSVTSADIDGDGKVDLTVANQISQNLSVLLGNGDGTFQAAKDSPATVSLSGSYGTSSSVTSADFNGDGKADIATSNYASDNVSVLLSDGNGTFQAAKRFPAGYGPHSVKSADFNGDSKADLTVANQHSDNVSVLLGNGDGTFQAAQNFVAADSLRSVTSADFNEDGKADLAVAHSSSFSYFWRPNYPEGLSVLLGNGDGTFQAANDYLVGDFPEWRLSSYVTTADFDGDTKKDLAIANDGSLSAAPSVSVMLGRGDGTFQFDQELSADIRPSSLAAANLDANNVPDLAVGTDGSPDKDPDNISVLMSIPRPTEVIIDSGPPQLTNSTTASFAFYSDESDATFECRRDDGPFESCTSPKEYSSLSEGFHTFEVRVFGAAGPDFSGSAYWDWTVDTTAPAAPVISSPPEGGRVGSSFTVSGTAEANSTVHLSEGAALMGSATATSTGTWSIVLSDITEGSHAFKAKATDPSGNISGESNSQTVIVDTVKPAAPSIPALKADSDTGSSSTDNMTNDTTPTFTGTAEAGSTVKIFDGTTEVGSATATSSSTYDISIPVDKALNQGDHDISATATDAAGNTSSASGTLSIKVDTTSPGLPGTPTHSLLSSSQLLSSTLPGTLPVNFTWSAATDNTGGSGIATYQVQQSTNGLAFTNVGQPSATSLKLELTPGTNIYRFQVRGTDRAGNTSSSFRAGPTFKVSALQESNSAIVDTGTWTTASLSGAYGGSVQHAGAAGRKATLNVPAGTKNVAWVSTKASNRGKAQVCVDPGTATQSCNTVDLYSSVTQPRSVVFSKEVSPATSHKLEVRVLGQKSASSTGTRVDVDTFTTTT